MVSWLAMSPMVSRLAMSPMVSCLLLSVVVQTQGLTWTPDTTGQTAKKIGVGKAGVFIIDKDNKLKEKKPGSWKDVGGGVDVADISVGKEKIWVVMKNNTIYTWKSSSWEKINGEMTQVCVNGDDDNDAWGLNKLGFTYKFSSGTWNLKPGWLRQITCGEAGVWGINPKDDVYSYKNGGFLGFLGWSKIDRKGNTFTWISSGMKPEEVWAVDDKGTVFTRLSNGDWAKVPGPSGQKMMQVDVFNGDAWGVDSNNQIYEYK